MNPEKLLAWCLANIVCDICSTERGSPREITGKKVVFVCMACEHFLSQVAPVDQPPLFPSITGEEESPESA